MAFPLYYITHKNTITYVCYFNGAANNSAIHGENMQFGMDWIFLSKLAPPSISLDRIDLEEHQLQLPLIGFLQPVRDALTFLFDLRKFTSLERSEKSN